MKVLTATRETQGARDSDFCWTVEGELVFFPPIECGRGDVDDVDDGCGCRRSMAGVVSHVATTTLARQDLDPDNYLTLIADGLESQGYVTEERAAVPEVQRWVHDVVNVLMSLTSPLAEGTVLERRGDFLRVRYSEAA